MGATQPRKLVASALVLFALCIVYNMVVIEGGFIPPLLVFAVVSLVLAGAMLQPWRWAPPMAAVWFLLVFATSVPIIVDDLSGANGVHQLLWQVVTTLVAAAAAGAASGVVATVRDRRGAAGGQRAAA